MATTKVEAALSVTSKDDSDEEFTAVKPAANDSSSLEDGKVKTAPATSKAASSHNEDSDEDSEDDKPPQKKAKADTRQSSSDDSSDESDGEANKKAMPPSSTGGTKTLFMGNLACNVEKSDIEKFFETAGRVVDVLLVTSKKDGSFMNYGYAEFSSEEEAQKALVEFQRKELLGRKIRLDVSVDMGPDGRVVRTPDRKLSVSASISFHPNGVNGCLTLLSSSSRFGDDHLTISSTVKPLLSRSSSYNGGVTAKKTSSGGGLTGWYQNRRRRSNSDNCLSAFPDGTNGTDGGQTTIGQEVGHAAAETFLLTRLCLKLLSYLGVGYRWITRFMALGCYAFLLMPGFIQVGYYYFFSPYVRRSIVYGDQPRNRLDLYLPKNSNGPKPVVAFVTGGAWIIGYKAWGSLLGQQLSERDIIVACIDYRNFPQGSISDMVKDASSGISFVCNHIAEYGGDPDRIYLMGQSAGAHIAACTIVEQVIKESGEGDSVSWSSSQINAYFGLSGGYNLLSLVDHFHSRGLYRSIFLSIMEGEESLRQFSPELVVQNPNLKHIIDRLPPFILFHGTDDYSIPSDASKSFAETLQRLGGKAKVILYEGKTHTDLFLQDPMRGGKDEMFEDIVSVVLGDNQELIGKSVDRRRLVPEFMLKLAHWVSPF